MRQGLTVPGGRKRSRKISKYLVSFMLDNLTDARCQFKAIALIEHSADWQLKAKIFSKKKIQGLVYHIRDLRI